MDNNYIRIRALYYYDDKDECYYARVPGFDGILENAESIEELERYLIEVISLHIEDDEEENIDYNKKLEYNLKAEDKKEFENYLSISFFLPYERTNIKEVYKKKTLTIPVWLDLLATKKKINFSKTLQEGLKKELKIK